MHTKVHSKFKHVGSPDTRESLFPPKQCLREFCHDIMHLFYDYLESETCFHMRRGLSVVKSVFWIDGAQCGFNIDISM